MLSRTDRVCGPSGIVGQARNHLRLALGHVLILTALVMMIPSSSCAQQVSSTGGQAGEFEPLSEQVTDPLSHLTQKQSKTCRRRQNRGPMLSRILYT